MRNVAPPQAAQPGEPRAANSRPLSCYILRMSRNARPFLKIVPAIMAIFIAVVAALPQNLIDASARIALAGLLLVISALAFVKSRQAG